MPCLVEGAAAGGPGWAGAGAASVQLPDAQFRLAARSASGTGSATGGHWSGISVSTGSSSTV
jgi:hypothetical protein